MKTHYFLKLTLINLFFFSFNSFGQCVYMDGPNKCPISPNHDPTKKRVLYVDHFLIFKNSIVSQGVDEFYSILGVDPNNDQIFELEDRLLEYARDHEFNSIILYDVHNVFNNSDEIYFVQGGPTRFDSYEGNLRRFIVKAKTGGYGINEVSIAIGGFSLPREVRFFNHIRDRVHCTLSLGERFEVSNKYQPKWDKFDYVEECNRTIVGVHNYNLRTASTTKLSDFKTKK